MRKNRPILLTRENWTKAHGVGGGIRIDLAITMGGLDAISFDVNDPRLWMGFRAVKPPTVRPIAGHHCRHGIDHIPLIL
jgi:hypothetical protein